jgi:branched-chain amino acid transport system ATP-binding protein
MSETLVRVEHLHAGHSGLAVVRDLNLHLDEGEIVALLGPNGAGKTTTLLTIAGLLPVIEGTADVFGRNQFGRSHRLAREGMAFVPDDRGLFFGLTTAENLRLATQRNGMKIDEVLSHFPSLALRMKVRAGALSGGEQQMLGLARAILKRPRIILIDELSMGLAPIVVQDLMKILVQCVRELKAAVLIVEQHVDAALEVSDRSYVLAHGELQLSGASADLANDRELLRSSYMGEAAIANDPGTVDGRLLSDSTAVPYASTVGQLDHTDR